MNYVCEIISFINVFRLPGNKFDSDIEIEVGKMDKYALASTHEKES
jgi:hypothetical protein